MNAAEILSVLRSGELDKLIGLEETDSFDAKKGIYDVSVDKGKFELAKDVAAFANSGGGIIVIGLATEQDEDSFKETVTAITPVPKDRFNIDGYRKIIFEYVYPDLAKQLTIDCVAHGADNGFIIYIHVSPTDVTEGPYIVSKSFEENNGVSKVRGNTLTLPIRKGSDTGFESPHDLQKMLRLGFKVEPSFDQVFKTLQAINNKLDQQSSRDATVTNNDEFTSEEEKRIGELRNSFFDEREGVIISTVFRPGPNEIIDIFSREAGSAMSLLEKPPFLRALGWNLETLDRAEMVGGEYIQVTNGDRKIIRLFRDGNIVFGASTDEDFLGHATTSRGHEGAINALAVTEVITEFIIFCEVLRVHLKTPPNFILVKMSLFNPKKEKKQIMFSISEAGMRWPTVEGTFQDENRQILKKFSIGESGIDYLKVSYQMVAEFFYFFGVSEDKFMYTKTNGAEKEIDTEMIKRMIY